MLQVVAVQTILTLNAPNVTCVVEQQTLTDKVLGVLSKKRIVCNVRNLLGNRIKYIQSGTFILNPDAILGVGSQVSNHIRAKGSTITLAMLKNLEMLPVKAGQTIACTYPDETLLILYKPRDKRLRQTISGGKGAFRVREITCCSRLTDTAKRK